MTTMHRRHQHHRSGTRHPGAGRARRGFTFTEVLFAVIILGIGFIMVAAIFPVAISQTRATVQETQGSISAQAAAAYIERMATDADYPVNNALTALTPAAWNKIKGNVISSADQRYAWVALYRRNGSGSTIPTNIAQIYIIPTHASGRVYTPSDIGGPIAASGDLRSLQVKMVDIDSIQEQADGSWRITFDDDPDEIIGERAFIIIASDGIPAPHTGKRNGHIYRIGTQLGALTYELDPATPFEPVIDQTDGTVAVPSLFDATAFIVGRDLAGEGGLVQDTAVYSTFIRLALPVAINNNP